MFQAPQRCEGLKHFNTQNRTATPGTRGVLPGPAHPCAGPFRLTPGSTRTHRPPRQSVRQGKFAARTRHCPDPALPGSRPCLVPAAGQACQPGPGRPGIPTFSDCCSLVGPHGLTGSPQRGNHGQPRSLTSSRPAYGHPDPGPLPALPTFSDTCPLVGPHQTHESPHVGKPGGYRALGTSRSRPAMRDLIRCATLQWIGGAQQLPPQRRTGSHARTAFRPTARSSPCGSLPKG